MSAGGSFGSDGEKYAKDVEEIINFGTSGNVAAFISEAIQVACTLNSEVNWSILFLCRSKFLDADFVHGREWGAS